eukprot:4487126-Prymnesium_polylepis.1
MATTRQTRGCVDMRCRLLPSPRPLGCALAAARAGRESRRCMRLWEGATRARPHHVRSPDGAKRAH